MLHASAMLFHLQRQHLFYAQQMATHSREALYDPQRQNGDSEACRTPTTPTCTVATLWKLIPHNGRLARHRLAMQRTLYSRRRLESRETHEIDANGEIHSGTSTRVRPAQPRLSRAVPHQWYRQCRSCLQTTSPHLLLQCRECQTGRTVAWRSAAVHAGTVRPRRACRERLMRNCKGVAVDWGNGCLRLTACHAMSLALQTLGELDTPGPSGSRDHSTQHRPLAAARPPWVAALCRWHQTQAHWRIGGRDGHWKLRVAWNAAKQTT